MLIEAAEEGNGSP
ncbi:hypothetical protein LINGRAHAP2_LOCUS32859 [Linum grandiflorum]